MIRYTEMTILKFLRSSGGKYLQCHSNICVSPFADDYNRINVTFTFSTSLIMCVHVRVRVCTANRESLVQITTKCELMEERRNRVKD